MGYWEQIGVANIRNRERCARMGQLQRALRDAAGNTLIWVACIALWALILTAVLVPALRSFFKW